MSIQIGKRDLVWSYMGVTSSLISNVVMIPLMVYFLDGETLGIWYVFQSLGVFALLLDFGFSPSFARNIAYCWSGASVLTKTGGVMVESSEVNFELFNRVILVCRRIYLVISMVALIVCLTAGTSYILFLTKGNYSVSLLAAWLIYILAIFLNLYYGYFLSFLRGVGAIAQLHKTTVIARLIQLASSVTLLFLGFGILAASIAYLLYGLSFRILARRAFYRYQGIGDRLKNEKGKSSSHKAWDLFFIIWPNTWRDGVVLFSIFVVNQAGTILCSLFFTLTQTASYSLSVQCTTAIAMIAAATYNAYVPSLQKAFITRDTQKACQDMSFTVVTYIILFVFGLTAFILIFMPLIGKIKSDVVLSVPMVLATGVYQFLLQLRNCYTSYLSATNRLTYMPAFVVAAVICVILSFVLAAYLPFGIWGLIIAQLLSHCVYNLWKWPILVHKELNLNFVKMFSIAYREAKALIIK